jgi:hypothetical protein
VVLILVENQITDFVMFYSIVQKIAVVRGPCVERGAGGGGFGVVHSKEDGLHLPLPKWLRMRGGEGERSRFGVV